MDSEDHEEPSCEDLLIDLEAEMGKICPWTCPNRVRQLLAKIAFKVHKDKDPVDKATLLTGISENVDLLKSLLKLIEECNDSTVLGNLLAISRELLSARTLWRPSALATFLDLEATEIIAKLLVRVCRPCVAHHQPSLSDHSFVCCFWILSALATKDTKFSLKIRTSGAIKTIAPILKHLSNKVGSLYPVLQVVKALSRNSVTSTILGRDGVVSLVTNVVTKLARNQFGPRLKVAAEALSNLTKARQNQLLITKGNFVQDLVQAFKNYELYLDRGRMTVKISGALLYIFQHIVGSKIGKQQFLEADGLEILREFTSKSIFDDKRWDRLLYRACTVMCKVCEAKTLPVESENCPAKFHIPDGHLILPEVESSSESTSRETTPESEASEEEDEGDDEDDEVAQQDDDEEEKNLPDIETVIPAKPIVQRQKSELEEEYASFFPEYSSPEILESHANNSKDISTSDTDYLTFAQQTRGLVNFAKVAYPDLVGGQSPQKLDEPLLEKNKQACRGKVINNIRRIVNEVKSEEHEQSVVYDLDELMETPENFPSPLGNTDESFVKNFNEANSELRFESRFESGNLRKAIHIGGRQYNLILTPDVNSDKHHQWFYFQVSHMKGGEHYPYIFNIINYEKANSQFNFGMQPVIFSVKEALEGRPHWRRTGADICYYRNNFSKSTQINGDNYMTASFTITFPHEGDICYLAYHYPYTYTRLRSKLDLYSAQKKADFYMKIDYLTQSLNHHQVPLLTITSRPSKSNGPSRPLSNQNIPISDKPIVVLSGRVHPGETNSSWVMEGILDFLTSDSLEADELRNHFIFKIIPMLNIEGVINGCHRCGLTGEDLNRRWQDPHVKLHPEIYHSKGLISYIKHVLAKDIFLFCDFHGHSRKKNVFLYGCSSLQSWWPPDHDFYDDPSIYKQLAETLHNIEPSFDKRSCRYTIERGRESTARVVIWREFDVPRSYTLEATFSGCNLGQLDGYHVKTQHLQHTGMTFLQSLMNLEVTNNENGEHPECKTSIEKDQAMKITRLVISMPQA